MKRSEGRETHLFSLQIGEERREERGKEKRRDKIREQRSEECDLMRFNECNKGGWRVV